MPHAVIRADGAPFMGSGHIMRCLTLAHAMKKAGWDITFVTRDFEHNYAGIIEKQGFVCRFLPRAEYTDQPVKDDLAHAHWLAVPQEEDAAQTIDAMAGEADLLIVDHYGIDCRWHEKMRPHARRILMIDDLADRRFDCDILLDQTYGRQAKDYEPLTPPQTQRLTGSDYMMLRDEFAAKRPAALQRRAKHYRIGRVFICLGSGDPSNLTGDILEALAPIKPGLKLDIVLSSKAPNLKAIRDQIENYPHETALLIDHDAIAERMVEADIAFGAAGTMSWERCCMGLPTLMFVIADNQVLIAQNLQEAGAVVNLGRQDAAIKSRIAGIFAKLADYPDLVRNMACRASDICDGQGVKRVLNIIQEGNEDAARAEGQSQTPSVT